MIPTVIADAGHESRKLARTLRQQQGWQLRIVKKRQRAFKITGLTWIVERSKVPPLFLDTALDPKFLPELGLDAVQSGNPTTGATIQPLPEPKYAENLPGINCQDCKAAADALEPNLVTPIPVPK